MLFCVIFFCQWLCQVLLGLVPKSQNWKIFFLVKKDIAMSWDKACLAIIHREKKQTNIIRVVFVQSHSFSWVWPNKTSRLKLRLSHSFNDLHTQMSQFNVAINFLRFNQRAMHAPAVLIFFFFFFLIPNKTSLMMENFC